MEETPVLVVILLFLGVFFGSLHAQDSDAGQGAARLGKGVSFSSDLADVLAKRCMGCHGGNRPRRDLRIESYALLMQGGENGEVIEPGDPENSLMILKMKGEADGDRMPPNGNPLSPSVIRQFEEWIQAGAKFDAKDPTFALNRLASASRLDKMTATQLAEEAETQAKKKWALVFPNSSPQFERSEQFLLVAAKVTPAHIELLEQAEAAFSDSMQRLGVESEKVRSPFTIFHIPKRYDFSEFSQMVEKRDSSGTQPTLYWRSDGGMGYVIVGPSSARAESRSKKQSLMSKSELNQFATSLILSRWGAPRWYADGLGFLSLEKTNRRAPVVRSWKQAAPRAMKTAKKATDIFEGRLPTAEADAAAWAWTKYLAKDKKRMTALHKAIADGNAFDRSFQGIYGKSPKAMCDGWLKWLNRGRKK